MSKKKTKALLLIVEGTTDEALFSALLQDHLEPKGIKIFPYRSDIFVPQRGDDPRKEIREKIREFVVHELEKQQISVANVLGIIHIGDMDGTFIPDDHILVSGEASQIEKTRYSDSHILVVNEDQRENIKLRNRLKSDNHRKMIRINRITINRKEIPYEHYFMSCDTDHLVFNLRNLTQEEKESLMDHFTDNNNSQTIRELLELHMDSCPEGIDPFKYTWEQIQQGIHSLSRKTNSLLMFRFIDHLLSTSSDPIRAD
ncbi:hypothetical protein [Cohnella cellulosilytica]|uniref:DUF4276 family protein n=1 Tax=Cohnella cellulosilytica TaxID=986710 RepID=A0ABW2FFN3_9BACL